MPNHDRKGTFETMKISEPWKPPAWLEPIFIYMAFTVAAVSALALLFWVLITFITPFNVYLTETEEISLTTGQTLQVKYPNLVLSGDTPAHIILILSGESNTANPTIFTVVIPPGLTIVEPAEQAQSKNVELTAPRPGNATAPTQMTIGVLNSHSMNGVLLFVRRPVEISSGSMSSSLRIGIGVETISWTSMRGIVNNTINERSTLLLLVTGFLSGAGTLVLQYMKTYRDRLREDRQRKEERFYKLLQDDFEGAINVFLRRSGMRSNDLEDFVLHKALVEQFNWYHRLSVNALVNLKDKEAVLGRQNAKKLTELCTVFEIQGEDTILAQSLWGLSDLLIIFNRKQQKILSLDDANNLLTAHNHWQEELDSIIFDLIQYFASSHENFDFFRSLWKHNEAWSDLLQKANLQHVLPHLSIENLSEDDPFLEVAHSLNWRPLWSSEKRKLSSKILRWLSRHLYESVDENSSIGSEYAELDNKLNEMAIPHPVIDQMSGPFPAIVFGDEGMGKTAAALLLLKKYQDLSMAHIEEAKVFPVYAPFEAQIDVRKWIAKKISQALIDFTADNPRRFLNAPEVQKIAMGRLMLWYSRSIDDLRIDLQASPFDISAGDRDKVLEYILQLKYLPTDSLTKDELLNLLYSARPDAFNQVYFLWDIPSTAPQEDVITEIRNMEGIAMHLARQNVFIKIFAPLAVKESLHGGTQKE